jgi:Na+/proline symporter
MDNQRSLIIFGCVFIYMLMCIAVGVWAMRRTKSSHDFFMAGRDLGIFVTGLAVFSSTLSGFGFVGGPGLVYAMGMSSVWMIVCSSIGFCISFYLLGKRLRLFAELRDTVSLPDAMAARYNSEMSRLLTALAILFGVVTYLSAQVLAMATVLRDILLNVDWMPEVSLATCMIISCTVLVFYCVTGGIIAGVYTDVVQGAVMVVAAILVFFAALNAVDGGMAGTVRTILEDDPEAIGPWGTLGMMGCLSWYFLFAIGGAGQPHIITKMMMNKKVKDAKHIMPVSMAAYTVSALLWISIGLSMRALIIQGAHPEISTPDAAAPQFLQYYVSPLLAGIVFAGLFAAIMSTADGFLNIGAAAAVHDIPKALTGKAMNNELFWARVATVVLAVGAGFIAMFSGELVALLGALGWGIFAAALVPGVAIGFNWKRATPLAANVAIGSSLVIILAVKAAERWADFSMPFAFHEGAVALLVSLTLFFGISLLSKPPTLDKDIDAVMDI